MRIIRTIIIASVMLFISMVISGGLHSSLAGAQTGAVITVGENNKITVTPTQSEESTASPAILYRVMGVVLVIWAGLAVYLFVIDRRVTSIEKEIRGRKTAGEP